MAIMKNFRGIQIRNSQNEKYFGVYFREFA